MLASPGCRGLYTAGCFLVLGSDRVTSARAGDGRTRVLVLNCYSQDNSRVNGGTECMGAYHQEVLGAFQFLSKICWCESDVQPSI
jgi:hypothetical protein